MEFTGGFKEDVDMIAGFDQAHATAQDALAGARAFFLIVLNDDDLQAHVGANASIEEIEDLSLTAAQVSKTIVGICQEHRDETD
jgi:hypothetical protein